MIRKFLLASFILALAFTWGEANPPMPILTNGEFEGGFTPDGTGDLIPNAWTKLETFSGGPGESSTLNQAGDNGPFFPGSWSLDWVRSNGGSSGDWTACEQILNYDVLDCQSLTLTIDVKAFSHNLGGSGWTAHEFEYPVSITIFYTDKGGTQRFWQWGWYIWIDAATGPRPDHKPVPNNGVVTAQQIPTNQWVPNTFDLFAELTNPKKITKIRVGGSGWDFEGRADNVQIFCVRRYAPTFTPLGLFLLMLAVAGFFGYMILRRRRAVVRAR